MHIFHHLFSGTCELVPSLLLSELLFGPYSKFVQIESFLKGFRVKYAFRTVCCVYRKKGTRKQVLLLAFSHWSWLGGGTVGQSRVRSEPGERGRIKSRRIKSLKPILSSLLLLYLRVHLLFDFFLSKLLKEAAKWRNQLSSWTFNLCESFSNWLLQNTDYLTFKKEKKGKKNEIPVHLKITGRYLVSVSFKSLRRRVRCPLVHLSPM